jgi:hypothetical protein
MVDFSKLRTEKETTHLFIPMSSLLEVQWLLDKASIKASDCHIKPWRQVLKHQVPAIKNLSDKQRDEEINKIYEENAKYVKDAPAVIVSHYNVDDLISALNDTLFGDGDYDYNEYTRKQQSEIDNEEIPDEEGIHVMSED